MCDQRYVPKHLAAILLEQKPVKQAWKTMGPAKLELPSPSNYLKKNAKRPKAPERTGTEGIHKTSTITKVRPPLHIRANQPLTPIKRDLLADVKPKPSRVDFAQAHKELLQSAGLSPKYIIKKDYGQVPTYLQQRRAAEQQARDDQARLEKEMQATRQVSEEERKATIEGLKKKWHEVHHEYQGLPFILYTPSQKARKIHMEEQLTELEKHIRLLEKFKTIYISDADANGCP
ncbi:enkurin-like isoform X1 [Poeciliopsis prolifica]|uniref:enkurin-like isoform X1 n=2 Tax=Poeciliopsis prolifica TaxID=188132 RepID=UPI00241435D3|nr:enkurin-like isoform X1 [Poeciliopsis prolifica]